MKICLSDIGKKFQQEWVFRKVNLELCSGDALAILGKNGSGKTTLLKLISGAVLPTEGEISFHHDNQVLSPENLYQYQAYAAPYHELIEELSVKEMLAFYFRFKPLKENLSPFDLLSSVNLTDAAEKKIRACSSGMKQKLKLALAIFSDTPLLLLDEPLTNLDREGILWFQQEMARRSGDRIIVVCSNHNAEEFDFCPLHFEMKGVRNFPF